jgi:manganese transport system substrate-binding protein
MVSRTVRGWSGLKGLATLMAVAGLVLAGCAPAPSAGGSGKPVVLTTFTVLADLTRNVGGEHVEVASITKVGAEIHGYEPTPSDLRAARHADLILDNGLGLEAWFAKFLADVDVPHVVVSAGIDPIPIRAGDPTGGPNPHAWMSPTTAASYVAVIADALADLDPAHATQFHDNAQRYTASLDAIGRELQEAVDRLPPNQRVLVTCEGAFSYLAREVGLREQYLWPVNSEQQVTPQQLAATIETVRASGVRAVFCESTVSDAAMRQVAEASGARLGGTLYVDSLSEADGPVPTLLDLLRHDVTTITSALGGATS